MGARDVCCLDFHLYEGFLELGSVIVVKSRSFSVMFLCFFLFLSLELCYVYNICMHLFDHEQLVLFLG